MFELNVSCVLIKVVEQGKVMLGLCGLALYVSIRECDVLILFSKRRLMGLNSTSRGKESKDTCMLYRK